MTAKNDSDFGREPVEETDDLSATGMFLRGYGKESSPAAPPSPAGQPDTWAASKPAGSTELPPAPPAVPTPRAVAADASASSPGGTRHPGEFTQFFKVEGHSESPAVAAQPSTLPLQAAPHAPPPASGPPTPGPAIGAGSAPASPGAGEFTRIFVRESSPPPQRTVDPAPAPSPPIGPQSSATSNVNPVRLKGFSTPGASDSASAGGFTAIFSGTPSARPPARPAETLGPQPASTFGPGFQRTSPAGVSANPDLRPAAQDPGTAFSATDMFVSRIRTPEELPPQPTPTAIPAAANPVPAYAAPAAVRPSEPSPLLDGSTTSLIQRLSQIAVASPVETPAGEEPALSPLPLVSGTMAAPARSEDLKLDPAKMAPKVEAPKIAAPKVEAPKVEAPKPPEIKKSVLESLAPILLVVNTFLLLLILLVVIFGLKGK